MKKLLFLFLLIPFLGNSQATFTAPVGYNTGAPTTNPSGVGTRWRFDLLTGKKYTWLPGTMSWDEDARGIDQVSGCSAPLYTPGYNQSTFAVNSCDPPELYQYTGAAWELLNAGTTYTAGTGIDITGDVISATGTGTVFEVRDSTSFRSFSEPDADVVILTDINRGGTFAQCVSCTADQYMIFTDALARKWQRINYNIIDPKWFGAIGDGLNDDGPALQRAVSSAAETKRGLLKINKGRYLVKSFQTAPSGLLNSSGVLVPAVSNYGIWVPSGVTISGSSRDSCLFVNGTGISIAMFRLTYNENIIIENIGMNMNEYLGCVGVSADSTVNVMVSNCNIYNSSWTVFGRIAEKLTIKNNILKSKRLGGGRAGHIIEIQGSKDVIIDNNFLLADFAQNVAFPDNASQGIECWTTYNNINNVNIKITNNTIKYSGTGIGCAACIDSYIQNNNIDSVQLSGILFTDSEQGLNITPSQNVYVSGNTVSNFGLHPVNGGNGMYFGTYNEDIKIFLNTIKDSYSEVNGQGHGIVLQDPPSRNIQIKNNLIENMHGNGIFAAKGNRLDIQQNTITDYSVASGRDGINMNVCDSSICANNTIQESRAPKRGNFGIHIQANVTNSSIFNNRTSANSWGVYAAARGSNVYWGNNVQYWRLTMDLVDINKAGMRIGNGSTADRDILPLSGTVRGNTTLVQFEGFLNGGWQSFVSGSGTINYVPLFNSTGNVTNSILQQSSSSIGINTSPNASAQLDVSSTTKGFLPPRMTQAQRNAISSPATALTLYCTDCTATDGSTGVMQVYNGSAWKNCW